MMMELLWFGDIDEIRPFIYYSLEKFLDQSDLLGDFI